MARAISGHKPAHPYIGSGQLFVPPPRISYFSFFQNSLLLFCAKTPSSPLKTVSNYCLLKVLCGTLVYLPAPLRPKVDAFLHIFYHSLRDARGSISLEKYSKVYRTTLDNKIQVIPEIYKICSRKITKGYLRRVSASGKSIR